MMLEGQGSQHLFWIHQKAARRSTRGDQLSLAACEEVHPCPAQLALHAASVDKYIFTCVRIVILLPVHYSRSLFSLAQQLRLPVCHCSSSNRRQVTQTNRFLVDE